MHRHLGRESNQAYGINKGLLDKMIAATTDDLRGFRDKALLSLAYDTLCRRSEIVSIDIEDIIIVNDQMKIRLRKSKTDPYGNGDLLNLSNKTKQFLFDWMKESKLISGKLFRGIKNNNEFSKSLNKSQINKIYKKYVGLVGLETNAISSHSIRVGASQDLAISGASLPIIMNLGRWTKTDTVMRYIKYANISLRVNVEKRLD
jgi:integrase